MLVAYTNSVEEGNLKLAERLISSGEVTLEEYYVTSGERLWNIAESLCEESNTSADTREVVEAIKCFNEVKGVDVTSLKAGQTIYLPTSLEGIV